MDASRSLEIFIVASAACSALMLIAYLTRRVSLKELALWLLGITVVCAAVYVTPRATCSDFAPWAAKNTAADCKR